MDYIGFASCCFDEQFHIVYEIAVWHKTLLGISGKDRKSFDVTESLRQFYAGECQSDSKTINAVNAIQGLALLKTLMDDSPVFELYKTENIWTFLKFETSTGKISYRRVGPGLARVQDFDVAHVCKCLFVANFVNNANYCFNNASVDYY